MTTDEAFALFRARCTERGLVSLHEEYFPRDFGHRSITVSHHGAHLRLAFDAREGALALEITHGPEGQTFWLDLYRAALAATGTFPASTEDPTFPQCVEYGLDLLLPSGIP